MWEGGCVCVVVWCVLPGCCLYSPILLMLYLCVDPNAVPVCVHVCSLRV